MRLHMKGSLDSPQRGRDPPAENHCFKAFLFYFFDYFHFDQSNSWVSLCFQWLHPSGQPLPEMADPAWATRNCHHAPAPDTSLE